MKSIIKEKLKMLFIYFEVTIKSILKIAIGILLKYKIINVS